MCLTTCLFLLPDYCWWMLAALLDCCWWILVSVWCFAWFCGAFEFVLPVSMTNMMCRLFVEVPMLLLQCMSLCASLLDCFVHLNPVVPVSVTNMMCKLFVEVPILLLQCMCINFWGNDKCFHPMYFDCYNSACLSLFGGLLLNSYQKCGCTIGLTDTK